MINVTEKEWSKMRKMSERYAILKGLVIFAFVMMLLYSVASQRVIDRTGYYDWDATQQELEHMLIIQEKPDMTYYDVIGLVLIVAGLTWVTTIFWLLLKEVKKKMRKEQNDIKMIEMKHDENE